MGQIRIRTAVMLIAVVALDFTLLREMPTVFLFVPMVAILIVSLNLVGLQFLALRGPLTAFHLGFLGAGFLFSLMTLSARPRILETFLTWYRHLTGDTSIWWYDGNNQLMVAEQGLNITLGLLSCLTGGFLAAYSVARLRSRSRVESDRAVSMTPANPI